MLYHSQIENDASLIVNYNFSSGFYYNGLSYLYSNLDDSNFYDLAGLMMIPLSSSGSYKGRILGDSSNVTGHFVDGESTKGFFFDGVSSVEVEDINSENIGSCNFLFSQEKTSKDAEVIFSNFNNNLSDPKGYEIGINSANKLYFEYIDSTGYRVYTLNNIPHKKNIYSVEINSEGNNLSLSWWNPFVENFETENFDIDSNYIDNSNTWTIGSGVHPSTEYKGYIDRFLVFDNALGTSEKELMCRSIYQDLEYVAPTSGYISGGVTGYSQEIDEVVTGVTGYEEIITGYTGNDKFYDIITGQNLYGTANAGEYIYELESDIYTDFDLYEQNITGIYTVTEVDEPTYGITGFATGLKTESYSWDVRPLYFYSGVTGELYKTYTSSPMYGDGYYYRTADESYSLSGAAPLVLSDGENGYGPRDYTYLGARNPSKDLIETQRGVNLFSVNNFAGVGYTGNLRGKRVVSFSSDLTFNYDAASLYINGVSQPKGSLAESLSDSRQKIFSVENGNFTPVSGNYEYSPFYAFYEDPYLSLIVDSPLIDVNDLHETQYLEINDVSDYDSAPFEEIDPSLNKIFFNGKKIYEGVDFQNDGGRFLPIGDLLQVTGVYHTEGDWKYDDESLDVSSTTGYGQYDFNSSVPFIEGSFLSNLNGIRLDPKAFIYHDSSVDLLAQGKAFIIENEKRNIYNNRENEFLYQDIVDDSIITLESGKDFDLILYGATNEAGTVLGQNYDAPPGLIGTSVFHPEIIQKGYDEV